jgi:hypothetical protein
MAVFFKLRYHNAFLAIKPLILTDTIMMTWTCLLCVGDVAGKRRTTPSFAIFAMTIFVQRHVICKNILGRGKSSEIMFGVGIAF